MKVKKKKEEIEKGVTISLRKQRIENNGKKKPKHHMQ